METQCSIGIFTEDECHKCVYGVVPKIITPINSYSEKDQFLFLSRVGPEVTTVCKYHENKFLIKFSHIFSRMCYDTLQQHKKDITKGLREITVDHLSKERNIDNISLIPGKSLCPTCYTKIFVIQIQETKTEDLDDTDFCEPSEVLNNIDSACSILGLSPPNKIRKLSSEKRVLTLKKRFDMVSSTIRKNLELSFHQHISTPSTSDEASSLNVEYEDLIKKLKEKCKVSDKETKVKILSLLPNSWSREKVSKEFNVSERLVRLAKEVTKEQGILPELQKRR